MSVWRKNMAPIAPCPPAHCHCRAGVPAEGQWDSGPRPRADRSGCTGCSVQYRTHGAPALHLSAQALGRLRGGRRGRIEMELHTSR